jgi:valyl-tRNA synthetase
LLEGIAGYGAVVFCFALITYTAQFDKLNLDTPQVVGYCQWYNKPWYAIRFAKSKWYYASVSMRTISPVYKFILSVLNKDVLKAISAMEAYKLSDAASVVYFWWLSQLCGVFFKTIKPDLMVGVLSAVAFRKGLVTVDERVEPDKTVGKLNKWPIILMNASTLKVKAIAILQFCLITRSTLKGVSEMKSEQIITRSLQ